MKVVHCKKEYYDVLIDRTTKWGNPFSHLVGTKAKYKVATRDEAIKKYEKWIQTQPDLIESLPELKSKILGCWCAPKHCHGEILLKLANKNEFFE